MPSPCVVLVGMMGAGKSTVGRALAKRLGWDFFDADHEIEAVTGVKIPVIFEIEGESGFRKRESHVVESLVHRRAVVVATGGGAVLSETNRREMHDNGYVIYLCASSEELYLRTRHDKGRPLLQTANPRQRIRELLEARDPLYREVAHCLIETGRQPVGNVVMAIIKAMQADARFNDVFSRLPANVADPLPAQAEGPAQTP